MAETLSTDELLPNLTTDELRFIDDVEKFTLSLLETARPFDLEHTKATVYWTKEICQHEGLDPIILLPAAYFHDTGYSKINNSKNNKNQNHAVISANIANNFILNHQFSRHLSYFQTFNIIHSVHYHDQLSQVHLFQNNIYLTTLLEAVTLAHIDVDRVGTIFHKDGLATYISKELIDQREPLITNAFSRKQYNILSAKLYSYCIQM